MAGTEREALDVDGRVLGYLYSRKWGRWLLTAMLKRWVLKLVEIYADSRVSRIHIKRFAHRRQISVDSDYSSFNDFFARSPSDLFFPEDPQSLPSPCEGILSIKENIGNLSNFFIKGERFSPSALMGETAELWHGGTAFIYRLTTAHCHRFFCFDGGTLSRIKSISGSYHSTHRAVWKLQMSDPLYKNHRIVQIFETSHFGSVAIVAIGSMLISSIRSHVSPGEHLQRGGHLGSFKLGGSALVMLFEKGVVEFDEALLHKDKYCGIGECCGRLSPERSLGRMK